MSDGVRVALFFAALFCAAAINTAFLPLWFADHGLSAAAIGQVLGLASLLRVMAGPGGGTLADRVGRHRRGRIVRVGPWHDRASWARRAPRMRGRRIGAALE